MEGILHYCPVAGETEMNEIVVLSNDLRTRAREVQSERLLGAAKVVELEDQVLRQV